jgi:phosphate transport system permease protein
MISLPLQVFTFIKSPEPNFIARGFGTAAVLLLVVLILFALARVVGGRGAGQLSARQRARALQQSRLDLYRITMRNDKNAVVSSKNADPSKAK